MNILDELNIPYIYLYKEYDSIHNRNFIFDFIILSNNQKYIIEYNGRQHYIPVEYLGGELRFNKLKIRDDNLREYCLIKSYKLLELKYNLKDDLIKYMINNFVNGNS